MVAVTEEEIDDDIPHPGYVPHIPDKMIAKSASTDDEPTSTNGSGTNGSGNNSIKRPVKPTVSSAFRSQMDSLLYTLKATSPHYTKCIKPNNLKEPNTFDEPMILEQLRYSGALEVVRIRQEGWPIAMSFLNFYRIFEVFSFNRNWKDSTGN